MRRERAAALGAVLSAGMVLGAGACQLVSGIGDLQIVDEGGAPDATMDGTGAEGSAEAAGDSAQDATAALDGTSDAASEAVDAADTAVDGGSEASPGDAQDATADGDAAGEAEAAADTGVEGGVEAAVEAGPDGAPDAGSDGPVVGPPDAGVGQSCTSYGLPKNCGPQGNEDCCSFVTITDPTQFARGYDGVDYTDASATATLDYPVKLDRFEVTVGRFNTFIQHYPPPPPMGAAQYRNQPQTGWDSAWNTNLPSTPQALVTQLTTGNCYQPFLAMQPQNSNYPINCVTWYEAFAFCAWDGGRLPTEAEWNLAAAAGHEQRVYPWSTPSTSETIDSTYAWYNCGVAGGVVGGGPCSMPLLAAAVGSDSPKGDGLYGLADLAGSVSEPTLDWFGPYPTPCTDCVATTSTNGQRVYRGGSWQNPPSALHAAARSSVDPTYVSPVLGFRCARN